MCCTEGAPESNAIFLMNIGNSIINKVKAMVGAKLVMIPSNWVGML